MKKVLPLFLSILFCQSAWAVNIGQVEQIQPSNLIPNYSDTFIFPTGQGVTTRTPVFFGLTAYNSTSFAGLSTAVLGASTITNAMGSDGNWINIATPATNGAYYYLYYTSISFTLNQQPRLSCTIKTGPNTSDIQNMSLAVELIDTGLAADWGAVLGFSAATSTTDFYTGYLASGVIQSPTVSSYPIAANTEYTLTLDCTQWVATNNIYAYINGTKIGTISTAQAGTHALTFIIGESNQSAATHNLKIKNIWYDYQ